VTYNAAFFPFLKYALIFSQQYGVSPQTSGDITFWLRSVVLFYPYFWLAVDHKGKAAHT
jgi:hypothetical protein